MKNAHLRFGWLTYVKSTEKTTTSIKLQIAAISTAISLGDRFMVESREPPHSERMPLSQPCAPILP